MAKLIQTEDIFSLPIDQYSRQKWAADFVDVLRSKNDKLKILDVGGYKGKTTIFQPKDNVIICDLFDVKEPNYVKGDGRKLPFKDSEFDFVLSFDTYEHVPSDGREEFVSELLRVSKEGVVLAAPFDDDEGSVFQAEVDLNDYYKKLYNKDHPWLKEHIDYRIPYLKELDSLLNRLSVSHTRVGSNDLTIWILMQSIYFSIELDEDLRGRVDDINRYYNHDLQILDIADKFSYRQIYFFSKNANNVKSVNQYIYQQKNAAQDGSKTHFMAYALIVFGQKYRDLELHKNYLESEIKSLKDQREKMSKELKDLAEQVDSKYLMRKIYKKIKRTRI